MKIKNESIAAVLILAITVTLVFFSSRFTNPEVKEVYPGKDASFSECHNLWDLGWLRKPANAVKLCEAHVNNPKFKIGQKVRLVTNFYDKSCKGTVVANFRFSTSEKNPVGIYNVNSPCNNSWNVLSETELRAVRNFRK